MIKGSDDADTISLGVYAPESERGAAAPLTIRMPQSKEGRHHVAVPVFSHIWSSNEEKEIYLSAGGRTLMCCSS